MKFIYTLLVITILISCSQERVEPREVVLDLPAVPFSYPNSDANEATLGRVLFYDTQLSVNNSISCASCHKQSIAFSDNRRFSRGFENLSTERNSMPIQNLNSFFDFRADFGFSAGLFWDGRGTDHSLAVLQPIVNHVEMGIRDLDKLTAKLSEIDYYPELFQNTYGTDEISPEKIGRALHAFVRNITSQNTKFDQSFSNPDILSAKEIVGMNLFISKYQCNNCHQVQSPQGYLFAGAFSNIGLETDDKGVGAITNAQEDNGKFKIPSLRNVLLTAPYMHDGRFQTIEEVIKHYSQGVTDDPNLDFRLKDTNGKPIRFDITDTEVSAIIAFLGTLTDHSMLTDEKLSNPFKLQ